MGTLRRNARDQQAPEDREHEPEEMLSVGKRTLLGASHGSGAIDVGKRTATQRLKRRSRETAFDHAVAELCAWLPRLASAISANDFDTAATAALTVRRALEDARELASAKEGQEVDALVAEAAALLGRAPELSEDACRERHRLNDKRPAWDAERQAWTASRGDAAPSTEPAIGEVAPAAPAAPAAVAEVAQRGVAGASAPLPFLERIQASFGRHDVSHVRTATGGEAAEAAAGLGAHAFTVANHVAFASSPDLHTAAHEAAHAVQQRSGVQLRGWIDGGASDPHEQHADAVADKVVRGESAERLLDQYSGGASGIAAIIQRKAAPSPGMVTARYYLKSNQVDAAKAIWEHLLARRLPEPHPRMPWRDEERFFDALKRELKRLDFGSPEAISAALAPHDPYALIDELRPLTKGVEDKNAGDDTSGGPVGPLKWLAPIGLALGQVFEEVVIASVQRLGARWVALADARKTPDDIEASDVARSHPMDAYVVKALCAPGVCTWSADTKTLGKKASKRDPNVKLQLTWMGKDGHKELWNWVRASPADATAEEVAAELFGADYFASSLAAAPPLFGIPAARAITMEETRGFRPAGVDVGGADPDHQVAALGGSTASDEQALLEIGAGGTAGTKAKTPPPSVNHDDLVADAKAQATHLKSVLAAWKLGSAADKALAFLARRAHDASDTAKWVPVLGAQRENLAQISTGISQLDAAAGELHVGKTSDRAAPLREVMQFYADAVATSHLNRTCNRMILRATNAQTSMVARGLAASLRDMDMSVEAMNAGVHPNDMDRQQIASRASRLRANATAMQSNMMRGYDVSNDDIEEMQVAAGEMALEARFLAIDVSLHELEKAAQEAGDGMAAWLAARFSSGFAGLRAATQDLRDRVHAIQREWQRAKNVADEPDEHDSFNPVGNRRKALETAKAGFGGLRQDDKGITAFLQDGANLVKWQQFRTACVRAAALIGVSLVGGFVGGLVMRGVAGLMAGTGGAVAIENLALGGAIVARGAGMVAETAISSVGQSLIFGDHLGTAFLENMIMSVGSAGTLKALSAIGEDLKAVARLEKATATMWQRVGARVAGAAGNVVLKEGVALAGHTIMGMAMGYVAHRMVTGEKHPSPAAMEDWLMQGASIAVGRYIGKGIEAHHARQAKLKLEGLASSHKLAADAAAIAELAKRVEHHPQAKDAMELLAKRHRLLTDEMKLLEEAETARASTKSASPSKAELATAKAEIRRQLAEVHGESFGEALLHFAQLNELIPGALWSGTRAQITHAIEVAQQSGIDMRATEDRQGGKWHVEIHGKKLEVEQRFDPTERASTEASANPAAHSRGDARPPSDARPTDTEAQARRETIVLAGDDTLLRSAAARAKPLAGYVDVILHGDANSFIVVREREDVRLDQRSIATYLRKHGGRGQKIRLIACEAGLTPDAVALHLANKLGVDVLAPTMTAWIDGAGNVGVGPRNQNVGTWATFHPGTRSSQDAAKAPMRTPEPPARAPHEPEEVAPLDVRFDYRARYRPEHHAELQARLGKKLVVNEHMVDGVKVTVERTRGLFGVEYIVRQVEIGAHASVEDIAGHAEQIKLVERYNGLIGKLRLAWDRLHGTAGTTFEGVHYAQGSRGWVLAQELDKIGKHIAATTFLRDNGAIDAIRANEEIAFLEGSVAYFREQLASVDAHGHDPLFDMSRPDIGETTKLAEAAQYKRPGQDGAAVSGLPPGTKLDPNDYYYRHSRSGDGTFELARKPMADAPQLNARVVGGKFVGIEVAKAEAVPKLADLGFAGAVKELMGAETTGTETPKTSTSKYVRMLVDQKLTTSTVVDAVLGIEYRRLIDKHPRATIDDLRGAVKDHFRARVEEHLLDPTLDAGASYRRMRRVVDGLDNADRGSLVEAWYRARYAPGASKRKQYQVKRTSGVNANKTETRIADLIVDGEIREVKDVAGPIDTEQFGAYIDALNDDKVRSVLGAKKLRYVFTKLEGAKQNMKFFVDKFEDRNLHDLLTVEYFDANGVPRSITSHAEAERALAQLQGQK